MEPKEPLNSTEVDTQGESTTDVTPETPVVEEGYQATSATEAATAEGQAIEESDEQADAEEAKRD